MSVYSGEGLMYFKRLQSSYMYMCNDEYVPDLIFVPFGCMPFGTGSKISQMDRSSSVQTGQQELDNAFPKYRFLASFQALHCELTLRFQ